MCYREDELDTIVCNKLKSWPGKPEGFSSLESLAGVFCLRRSLERRITSERLVQILIE